MLKMTTNHTKLEKALLNAKASARMEGFQVSERSMKFAEAIVTGKMTKEDYLKQILAERV